MTIVPFLMMWGLIFALLLLLALGIAIALNTQPKKTPGTQPPAPIQAKLHIVPVPPLGLPGRPITDQVVDLKNVICNVRFPINR